VDRELASTKKFSLMRFYQPVDQLTKDLASFMLSVIKLAYLVLYQQWSIVVSRMNEDEPNQRMRERKPLSLLAEMIRYSIVM
jgi:hypothetical protein